MVKLLNPARNVSKSDKPKAIEFGESGATERQFLDALRILATAKDQKRSNANIPPGLWHRTPYFDELGDKVASEKSFSDYL